MFMYQNEAGKKKIKKITWPTHPKAEVVVPTCSQLTGKCRSCNIVLETPGHAQEAVRAIHSEVGAWKLFFTDEML